MRVGLQKKPHPKPTSQKKCVQAQGQVRQPREVLAGSEQGFFCEH